MIWTEEADLLNYLSVGRKEGIRMKKKKQDNKGFTLIELVIVVAILAFSTYLVYLLLSIPSM